MKATMYRCALLGVDECQLTLDKLNQIITDLNSDFKEDAEDKE